MKKWPMLLSLLVFLVAVFFRFYQLGAVPVALYWDEIAMLVDARAVAETGHDMHGNSMWQAIFPSYGDYKLPVYIWLASLSVKLFGASEWALRLPSALAGLGTMIFAGLIIGNLFAKQSQRVKNWLGVLAMLMIAVAPWSILFSRTAFEGHVAQFLLTVSVWLVLKKQRWGEWRVLASILGAVATYTYFSVRFIWPVLFISLSLLFVLDFGKRRSLLANLKMIFGFIGLPLLIYFISLQPMYNSPLYAVSNQFRLSTTSVLNMKDWPVESNQYKLLAGNQLLDKVTYHPYLLMARELARNYADNMSIDFLFLTGDPNLRHGTGQHGLFLWIFLPSFIYGWYKLFPNYWRQGVVLLVWWLLALLPASVPESTPHALRSLNALVPLTIVLAWGSYQLLNDLNHLRVIVRVKWLFKTGLIIMTSLVVVNFASYLFKVYPAESASSWQAGYQQVAELIAAEKEGKDTIWVEPFDSRFHLWVLGYETSVADFSEIEFNNYVPKRIGQIVFAPFDWQKVTTMEPKTIVAGRKELLDQKLALSPVKPTWYKTVTTADGETPFAIIYFEK
ncbi:MAG: ArnT family glycosyltransferase [Patescibacteria group bacterium]